MSKHLILFVSYLPAGEELNFAKATQLPDVLRSEKTKLEEEKRQLKLARLQRNKQCWHYYQVSNAPFKLTSPGNFPSESLQILRAGRPGEV